jgi:response regulator RpfG family c-di-GMP phosphodiesterase
VDEERTMQIRPASSLYDAGKIGVPDQILRKPGRHSLDEREVMKKHADIGNSLFNDSV